VLGSWRSATTLAVARAWIADERRPRLHERLRTLVLVVLNRPQLSPHHILVLNPYETVLRSKLSRFAPHLSQWITDPFSILQIVFTTRNIYTIIGKADYTPFSWVMSSKTAATKFSINLDGATFQQSGSQKTNSKFTQNGLFIHPANISIEIGSMGFDQNYEIR
jgi:hypothetical protein